MTLLIRVLQRAWLCCLLGCLALCQPVIAAPPADAVRIHFHRSNHDYTGWGLHVWGEGARLPRAVTWTQPLEPAGVDDFGVYFDVPIAPDARNLPFVLHRGDTKNVPEDQTLVLSHHGREVWVLENSATLFTQRPAIESDFLLGAQAEQSSQRTRLFMWMAAMAVGLALVVAWTLSQRRLSATRQQLAQQVNLLVEAQRELQKQGEHIRRGLDDELTGLPTRTALQQALDRALGRCKREEAQLAVLFIDLDGFKQVNDTDGHAAGDEVLRTVAERFRGGLRDSDLVARVGGDEFVAVVESLHTAHDAFRVGRKLIRSACEPIVNGERVHRVSASVGVAVYPGDGEDGTSLIKSADSAMYDAKKAGKNACRFHQPALQREAEARMEQEQGLRDALERYELLLHYEPVIDVRDDGVVGLAAVLRWMRGGELQPVDEVFEIARDAGMIDALDRWTLLETMRQVRGWQAAGGLLLPVTVTMNGLPSSQMCEAAWGDDPGLAARLCLKFPAGVWRDQRFDVSAVSELRRSGVRLALQADAAPALDLMRVIELRPDQLLLGGALLGAAVSDEQGPQAQAVRAMAAAAPLLGFRIAAEHVDSAAAKEAAARLGCLQVQGRGCHPAVPAAEAESWLGPRHRS